MNDYLNDTYKIIPEMQKSFYFQKGKIQAFDDFLSQFGERMDDIESKLDDFDKRINDININTNTNTPQQEMNMADLLKANDITGDIDGEENNKVVINLITKLESRMNNKMKMNDERLSKMEQNNYKSQKEIQNIKNAQDLNKRNINMLKQSNENMITNMKMLESKIKNKGAEIEQRFELEQKETKIIKKESIKEIKEKENASILESPKKDEKERKDSYISESRKTEPQFDLENNEKIKEIISKLSDLETSVKKIPNQLGIEQIKLDVNTVKSAIRNFALINDLKESKEKEEDIQKQLNFLKEQFEDFISNNADHEDLQNVKRKMELLNSKAHELEENYQLLSNRLNIDNKNKTSVTSTDKYLETIIFDNFKSQIIKEFSSVNDNFTHLRRLVDNILESLKNKPSYRDIKALEEEIMLKYEELKVASNKKFAERIETTKNFKYLDTQIKNILQIYIKKEKRSENWILAKKPITNLCASCEAYIGELKDNNSYQPWNKYPLKDPNDKVYRLGNGFSKMLQMVQLDENDKKNMGMATQLNNNEFNLGSKLLKLDKVDTNLPNDNNYGQIKTELNNKDNKEKSLPKIKGNNTMTNFTKKNNNNTVENISKTKKGNNFMKEIDTSEQLDMKNFSDDDEEKQPKILKITKINKE